MNFIIDKTFHLKNHARMSSTKDYDTSQKIASAGHLLIIVTTSTYTLSRLHRRLQDRISYYLHSATSARYSGNGRPGLWRSQYLSGWVTVYFYFIFFI